MIANEDNLKILEVVYLQVIILFIVEYAGSFSLFHVCFSPTISIRTFGLVQGYEYKLLLCFGVVAFQEITLCPTRLAKQESKQVKKKPPYLSCTSKTTLSVLYYIPLQF
jgi:hypothetical protein